MFKRRKCDTTQKNQFDSQKMSYLCQDFLHDGSSNSLLRLDNIGIFSCINKSLSVFIQCCNLIPIHFHFFKWLLGMIVSLRLRHCTDTNCCFNSFTTPRVHFSF